MRNETAATNQTKPFGAFAKANLSGNMVCICSTESATLEGAAKTMSRFAYCATSGQRANVIELTREQFDSSEPIVYTQSAFAAII